MFRKCRFKFALTFVLIFMWFAVSLGEERPRLRTSSFDARWLKAVVSLEVPSGNEAWRSIGTGFLLDSPNHHIILVTAKHVITDDLGRIRENLAYRLNNRKGKSLILTAEQFGDLGKQGWFVAKNDDLACRLIFRKHSSDVLFIPLSLLLPSDEIDAGTPLIVLGFPLGLRSEEYAVPIARRAMVARVDTDLILVDGFVFPGNSGGPVIYVPFLKFGKGLKSSILNEQRLVGVVTESISYVEVATSAHSGRKRISFEDNAGLCKVIPADAVIALIGRADVSAFDNRINSGNSK